MIEPKNEDFSQWCYLNRNHLEQITAICILIPTLYNDFSKSKNALFFLNSISLFWKQPPNFQAKNVRKNIFFFFWRKIWVILKNQDFFCCCSVAKLCSTLLDPVDFSTPGLSVLDYLLEFAQTHVLPFHPLPYPSLLAFNLSQHQGLFWWIGSLHQVAKVLKVQLQHQFFQWIISQFRIDWFDLLAVPGMLKNRLNNF